MTAAVIGFIGAVLGATTALVSAYFSDRRQARHEQDRWRRDQRGVAYEQALRHLLRAANWRSALSYSAGNGMTFHVEQAQVGDLRAWFDSLLEAQFWLRTLATRCGAAQMDQIRSAALKIDQAISTADSRGPENVNQLLWDATEIVEECSRMDMGGNAITGHIGKLPRPDPTTAGTAK
jgi:hypothetical protein